MNFDYNRTTWGTQTASLKWTDPTNVRLRRALNSFRTLSSGSKILEVGCGAGSFIRALKEHRPDLECFGADISDTAITQARELGETVVYSKCDQDSLPYLDNYFDGISIFDVLEHVEKPDIFMSEIHRVLKPGGLVYLFVPCEDDFTSLWRLLDKLHKKNDLTKKYAGHINFYSRKKLLVLMELSGFQIIKKTYAEHFFGQILGVAVFKAMDRFAVKTGAQQLNNETFFKRSHNTGMSFVKKIINFLITLESTLLFCVPSPNIHVTARKNKTL